MKTFNKANNKKLVAGIVTLFSAAAVVSTGFASWVISATDSKDVTGNIVVDSVSNENHLVTLGTPSKTSIIFGTTSEGNTCSWLSNSSIGEEVLSFTVDVSVANVATAPANEAAILNDATFDVGTKVGETWTTSKETKWNVIADGTATAAGVGSAAANPDGNKGLVAAPTLSYSAGAYDSSAKEYTATLTVTFGWGQLFGGNNPLNYYYGTDVNAKGAEATARLDALNTALSGQMYKITVSSK